MPATRKILIVDDSPEDRETWRRFLLNHAENEYVAVERGTIEEGLEACQTEWPDCILLDYNLPDGTGVEFVKGLWEIGGPLAFPVVMLTGTGSELVAVEAMKAGVQDYLVKNRLNSESLHRALDTAIYKAESGRLITQQRKELEDAYQLARDANARKDQFLAALSHELRTPLTAILAAVSAPDVNEFSAQERTEIFTLIRRNVEMEARLIDDLLDITRITHGKLEMHRRDADVHELIRHALDIARPTAQSKRVTLETALSAGQHGVHADASRLQQVFWNLLNNAVKFTPAGGTVRIETQNPAEGRIEVKVNDTGVGIPADKIDRIFNAFEQGDAQVTRQFGGLGLGLAICKALVDAHGGQIQAESDGPGRGATFRVTLATVATSEPEVPQPEPEAAKAAPAAAAASTMRRVLLVEDHADSARMLIALMRRRGYQVTHADTVAEAQTLFERETFDVVVSDLGLPDGSGLDLIRALRWVRLVPCIVLSGYGMEDDLAASIEAGAQAHLTKPVEWPRLQEALERLVPSKE